MLLKNKFFLTQIILKQYFCRGERDFAHDKGRKLTETQPLKQFKL